MSTPIAVADRIFGRDDSDAPAGGAWLLRYLGVAVLLAAVIIVRRPDAVTNPQFWAEDSTIFFWQQLTRGFRGALGSLYSNYPFLAQRLIAALGARVPLADVPRVYSTSALVLTALALASFALPGFRHLVRSDALRVVWCVAAVSLPVGQEMLSTPTNLGWYLAIWLALLSVMRVPRTWWRVAGLAACGTITVFTAPLSFVTVPVWLLRIWHARARRNARELWLCLAVVAAVVAVVALTRNLGVASPEFRLGGEGRSLLADRTFVLARWRALLADRVAALLLAPQALAAARAEGGIPTALAALVAAATVAASWWGRFATLPALLVAAYFFVGSMLLETLGRPSLLVLTYKEIPWRYTVFPAAMLVLGLLAAVEAIPVRRARMLAAGGLVAVFLWAWWPTFVVPPLLDQQWAAWAKRLEGEITLQTVEPLGVPMNPRWNPLRINARAMSTETVVPPAGIIASLGSVGKFRQSFLSHCDGLSQVDLLLGSTAAASQGGVRFTVTDQESNTVVAHKEIPRSDLGEGGWQSFFFAPVAGSAGRSYMVQLQAIANDPEQSLLIWGTAGSDLYPDGYAIFLGQRIEGDASFRYGCTVPGTELPAPRSSPP